MSHQTNHTIEGANEPSNGTKGGSNSGSTDTYRNGIKEEHTGISGSSLSQDWNPNDQCVLNNSRGGRVREETDYRAQGLRDGRKVWWAKLPIRSRVVGTSEGKGGADDNFNDVHGHDKKNGM